MKGDDIERIMRQPMNFIESLCENFESEIKQENFIKQDPKDDCKIKS